MLPSPSRLPRRTITFDYVALPLRRVGLRQGCSRSPMRLRWILGDGTAPASRDDTSIGMGRPWLVRHSDIGLASSRIGHVCDTTAAIFQVEARKFG